MKIHIAVLLVVAMAMASLTTALEFDQKHSLEFDQKHVKGNLATMVDLHERNLKRKTASQKARDKAKAEAARAERLRKQAARKKAAAEAKAKRDARKAAQKKAAAEAKAKRDARKAAQKKAAAEAKAKRDARKAAQKKAAAEAEAKREARKAAQKKAAAERDAKNKAQKEARKAAAKERAAAKAAAKAARLKTQREERAAREAEKAERNAARREANAKRQEDRDAARAARQKARAAAKAARDAEKQAKREAREEAKKAREAARAIRKDQRKNRKRNKKPEKNLGIVGGNCVADHICATVRGDPHLTTFDGLKFDCQGHGEFTLSKSMETSFEIQARFLKRGMNRKGRSVSIQKAISIDTGVEGAPQLDVFTEEVEGVCILDYYVDGELADFGEDGKAIDGIDFMPNVDGGRDLVDFVYFTGSGVMLTATVSGKCVMNTKICLPPKMVREETIFGLLGTPNGNKADDWVSAYGKNLAHGGKTGLKDSYEYCTREWCTHDEDESIFGYLDGTSWDTYYGCADSYDSTADELVSNPTQACIDCCAPQTGEAENDACLLECMEGDQEACMIEIEQVELMEDVEKKCPDTTPNPAPPKDPQPSPSPAPKSGPDDDTPKERKGAVSGDPHFKTWTGDKYDYHGECDLVLLDNPGFADGLGLRVHIRTTRVRYFSFIEKVAIQIGEDVMEFSNDVDTFLINGRLAEVNKKHHRTFLGGYLVRRDSKSLSIRLQEGHGAKIDLHMRKNGFPAVVVDGGNTDIFDGSLGLLGDWETGKRLARDGETELGDKDATAFALEWQVRDTEPMLFEEARFPQFPTTCTPPEKMPNRLGMASMEKEAEKVCAHWKEDKEDCIFDVIATRDVLVAEEGHIVHVE